MRFFQYLVFFLFISFQGFAQNISIIRDTETEDFLYELTEPIFEAAGLDISALKIYIINDNSLNAFVSGGQNIFINTGLITKYDSPDTLIGVIAHEVGHIGSGHLARSKEAMKNAGNAMILTYLAGIAAAMSSEPDAGYAILMGGSQVTERLALKYNRGQEEAADQLALKYLEKTGESPLGLLKLLESFNQRELSSGISIDEYSLTHPVSKKRINYIKSNLEGYKNTPKTSKDLQKKMERIVTKLKAFLQDPRTTLRQNRSESSSSKYAKTIAYFKKGEIKKSISNINELIKMDEGDGYLHELKGQILFESGHIKESIISYKKSIELLKNNNLAKIAMSKAILALNSSDKELTGFVIDTLLSTLPKEKDDPSVFKQLSAAYNRNKDPGNSYLALAELNLLKNDKTKAKKYAKLAKKHLKNDKTGLIKADDILEIIKKDVADSG